MTEGRAPTINPDSLQTDAVSAILTFSLPHASRNASGYPRPPVHPLALLHHNRIFATFLPSSRPLSSTPRTFPSPKRLEDEFLWHIPIIHPYRERIHGP